MRIQDILLALLVPLIWGFGLVFAKAALEHFPPILLMAFRFEVTALAMIWFVKPPWRLMGKIFLISLVSAALQYGFTFTGLKYLDASTAALVVQLEVPFMVLLGAIFLGEKPGLKNMRASRSLLSAWDLLSASPACKAPICRWRWW